MLDCAVGRDWKVGFVVLTLSSLVLMQWPCASHIYSLRVSGLAAALRYLFSDVPLGGGEGSILLSAVTFAHSWCKAARYFCSTRGQLQIMELPGLNSLTAKTVWHACRGTRD